MHGSTSSSPGCSAEGGATALAWHPTSVLLAFSCGARVLVLAPAECAPEEGELVACDPGEPPPGVRALPSAAAASVTTLAFSQNGLLLAVGSQGGQVRAASGYLKSHDFRQSSSGLG